MLHNKKDPILIISLLAIVFLLGSCQTETIDKTASLSPNRPNILWLVTEDMGAYIPPFGDSTIQTPNLSRLAKEGVIYPNLYSTSGVCAPSRAAIATGMYPSSIGANHMRTNSNMDKTGLPTYEAVPPPQVKMISELLRLEGYYCTNNYKEDYQFKAPKTAWDESSKYAHWRNRKDNQPFFSVFNFTETHESGLFEPYGFRHIEARHYHSGDTSYTWKPGRMTEAETPVHLSKNTEFSIPPYLPDNEVVRNDMWKLYNNISEMDSQIGAVLDQLEEDGLLENTIIMFYGDHGGPLPRQKRLVYDSGLNTPMIIRFPDKWNAGTKDEQLVSFVDFAPTLLSLSGTEPFDYMQGQAFLGDYKSKKERNLANQPEHQDKLQELKKEMKRWLAAIDDQPNLPEQELINRLWNNKKTQPITAPPTIKTSNGKIKIDCPTEGASIGYKIITDQGTTLKAWSVYTTPFEVSTDRKLLVKAHRIGYKASKKVKIGVADLE